MNCIKQHIEENYNLLREIEKISQKIEILDDNKRNMLFAGFYRNALSHYCSITILIERELYNSAFALIRVLFENIVRAKYMYIWFSDEEITKMYSANNYDKFFNARDKVNMAIMCEKLDEFYEINFYKQIKDKTYKNMNDYTHTGANQIARNFNNDEGIIEPSFSEDLILNTLVGVNTLIQTFVMIYFEQIGLKQNEINREEIEIFMKIIDIPSTIKYQRARDE